MMSLGSVRCGVSPTLFAQGEEDELCCFIHLTHGSSGRSMGILLLPHQDKLSCFPWLHFDFFGYVLRVPQLFPSSHSLCQSPNCPVGAYLLKYVCRCWLLSVPPAGALR